MQTYAQMALSIARQQGMFVVLDADALYTVGKDVSTIQGYRRAVLTPNVMEFKRLTERLGIDQKAPENKQASLVSKALGGVTVVQKGPKDIISVDTTGKTADPEASKVSDEAREAVQEQIEIDVKGGNKRCGGQGDVLSGCVGTIMAWGKCYEDGAFGYVDLSGLTFDMMPDNYFKIYCAKGSIHRHLAHSDTGFGRWVHDNPHGKPNRLRENGKSTCYAGYYSGTGRCIRGALWRGRTVWRQVDRSW